MALLSQQQVTSAGTAPSYTAATAGGDTVQPGATSYIHVKNGGGGSITVTVASPGACSQGFTHPTVVAVPAGTEARIGPFPASRYADPTDGLVHITYSGVTTVTVASVLV